LILKLTVNSFLNCFYSLHFTFASGRPKPRSSIYALIRGRVTGTGNTYIVIVNWDIYFFSLSLLYYATYSVLRHELQLGLYTEQHYIRFRKQMALELRTQRRGHLGLYAYFSGDLLTLARCINGTIDHRQLVASYLMLNITVTLKCRLDITEGHCN